MAVREFDREWREIRNAQERLRERRARLHAEDDADETREIDQELRLLGGRLQSLNRTTSL